MTRVWKEVLCRGRQCDRYGRWFTIGDEDIAEAYLNAGKMLSRGVPVPCVWEHQAVDAGSPADELARYAKYTFGHMGGRRINDRGNVELALDVPDEADRKQLAKVKYVSPKLFNGFRDSKGGRYTGTTIGHVAATPTPVQHWQRPFELSQGDALILSFTPEGSTVADDADKDKGGKGAVSSGDLAAIIDALRAQGMNIPDEVTDGPGLVIAIKAAGGGGSPDDDTDDDLDLDGGGTTAAAGGGPTLMSDGRAKTRLVQITRKDLKGRIEKLFTTGRVTKPTAHALWASARAVELSFTRDSAELVPNKVITRVETLEQLPEHTAWKPDGTATGTELSDGRTTAVAAPAKLKGNAGVTPEAVQEATDFLLAGIPGPAAAKK